MYCIFLRMTFEGSHHLISLSYSPNTPCSSPLFPSTWQFSQLVQISPSPFLFLLFLLKCSFPTFLPNVTPPIKLSLKPLLQSQSYPAELLIPFYSPTGGFSHLPYSTSYTVLKSHSLYVNLTQWVGCSLWEDHKQ